MKQNTCSASRVIQIVSQSLILCFILLPVALQADELTEPEVQAAVQTWVRYVTAEAKPDAVIERMEPHEIDGNIVAYVAYIAGGGFCLCGKDSLVLPVYIYSPQGKFNPENPGYQYVLSEIAERTQLLSKAKGQMSTVFLRHEETLKTRERLWQDLIEGIVPAMMTTEDSAEAEPDMMDLGLTSRWHQDPPYNDQCPFLTSTAERTLVGCTATATSQIMYYWKWPNTGMGTKTNIYQYRYRNNWDYEPLTTNPDPARFPGVWRQRLDWTNTGGGRLWITGYWDLSIYNSARGLSTNADYRTALETLYNRLPPVSKSGTANF